MWVGLSALVRVACSHAFLKDSRGSMDDGLVVDFLEDTIKTTQSGWVNQGAAYISGCGWLEEASLIHAEKEETFLQP